nr:putative reverse transcriptase domain-containing protein [Tanacetum cinerariifolium]
MPLEGVHIDDTLQFVEEPIEIMEREIKRLKRSRIPLVKVRWNSRRGPEFTWERKDSFKKKYPHLFTNRTFVVREPVPFSCTSRFYCGDGIAKNRAIILASSVPLHWPVPLRELPGMVRVRNITYFQDYKWHDELADGKLKEETLIQKAKVEELWGNATPSVMKFCSWLINSFWNFHELEYNVLVKLQECWWKINAHEVAPFTCLESYGQRPYANIKTEKAHDPYLETNNIFGRNYDTSNAGNTQDNQGHEECRNDPTFEPSVCKIRRFEIMKYSFNADEEYIGIKESEYLNHSKENLDAYRELLRIIDEGWVVATPDEEGRGKEKVKLND